MRHSNRHSHPCERCGLESECDGDLERNVDGWPETICRQFHVDARPAEFLCEECAGAVCDCGEPATQRWDEGADFAYWTGQPRYTPVCTDCYNERDNAEPPEPDGEAFRGGEAAAFAAEQQAQVRKLK